MAGESSKSTEDEFIEKGIAHHYGEGGIGSGVLETDEESSAVFF